MVIWLLGISGAGKTTLGQRLNKELQAKGIKTSVLDGDVIRSFFDNDLGYSTEDRKMNVKRIMLASHLLSESGIVAIVCNISPFEELRQIARKKIKNYHQIFLNKSLELSMENDVKGVYRENSSNIVGKDLQFDEPISNELVIFPDSESEEESFKKVLNYVNLNL